MLRLTDIKLPLDHPPEAIEQAVLAKLGIPKSELLSCTLFKRGNDARKKQAILLVYALDVELKNEEAILKRFAKDQNVSRRRTWNTAAWQRLRKNFPHALWSSVPGRADCSLRSCWRRWDLSPSS